MTKKLSSATGLLIGGFVFFVLGLLLILHQNPLFGWFSQILPDIQSVNVAGVAVQFIGQAFVVFGIMRSTSDKLISHMQNERQITMTGIAQNMQQIQTEQQALKTGYLQTITKLDALLANQKSVTFTSKTSMSAKCKFCGAQIETGYFCPQCGKAN